MNKSFDTRRQEFSPYGLSCELWTPTQMPRPDRHNEIEMNLLSGGELTYLMNGRRTTVAGGRLVLFWAAIPHQIVSFSATKPYFVATIPLSLFLEWKLPDHFAQAILNGALAVDRAQGTAENDRRLLNRWVTDLSSSSAESARIVQLEMEARIRRLCMEYRQPVQHAFLSRQGKPQIGAIERMAAFITQHCTEPLTLGRIGQAVDLHPNYAAALFRKAFGVTLNAYIGLHRVANAQRLLVTSDRKVIQVALDSGYNSLSRFNVAFKRICGCTPREYRKRTYATS
jgi:AraC family transcriptional regulator, melibiose operon regulatory protein